MTESITLDIDGMHCAGCADTVRALLMAQGGVSAADVSLEKGQAQVRFDPNAVSVAQLTAAVGQAGYSAKAGRS